MTDFRAWLIRTPVPVTLRVWDGDGESQCVRFAATGRGRVDDALSACRNATRVDALDKDNAVLRSWEPAAPTAPAPVPAGVDSGALVQIARLLNEAGDKAAARHARAYEMAFEKQAELLGIIVRRLDASERMVAALLVETVRQDAASAAEPAPPDPTDAIAMQLLQGAMMGGAAAPPNGKGTQ